MKSGGGDGVKSKRTKKMKKRWLTRTHTVRHYLALQS